MGELKNVHFLLAKTQHPFKGITVYHFKRAANFGDFYVPTFWQIFLSQKSKRNFAGFGVAL